MSGSKDYNMMTVPSLKLELKNRNIMEYNGEKIYKLRKDDLIKALVLSDKKKSNKKTKKTPRKSPIKTTKNSNKSCNEIGKILNPVSGRCVSVEGKIGKKLSNVSSPIKRKSSSPGKKEKSPVKRKVSSPGKKEKSPVKITQNNITALHIWDLVKKKSYTDDVWLTEWNGNPAVAKKIGMFAGGDIRLKGEKYCDYITKVTKYAYDKGIGPNVYKTETDDDGNCYILTEYLPTIYTPDVVKSIRPEYKTRIIDEINKMIVKMHRLGLYHGDIRPRNVGWTDDGTIAFIDWDYSRFINDMKRDKANGKLTIGGEKVDLKDALKSEFIEDLY